jgi:hypothetical protein
MEVRDRWRGLREQLDELTDVDWRDPSWWGFAGGALALRILADRGAQRDRDRDRHLYLAANGGPRSDNYMGRDAKPPDDAAHAIAQAVTRGTAALETLAALDGTLPDQPLRVALADEAGWLRRRAVDGIDRRVAFVLPSGCYTGELTPDTEAAVATALGAILAGRDAAPVALRRIDPESREPTPAAVAVAVGIHAVHLIQHAHRRAWTAGGGPWLGVGDAPPIEAVTTCHVVVDGYGHARVTSEIFDRVRRDPGALIAAARLGLGGVPAPVPRLPAPAGAAPLSFAGRALSADIGGFPEQSYAFGRALERTFRAHLPDAARKQASHSPTFQVPVAPGDPGDAERRKRRVVHALVALQMSRGAFEPFADYRARLRPLLTRELAADGLLPQLSLGIARSPLPLRVRRWLLQSRHRTHKRMPPYEVITGRGRFSSMRFPRGERPAAPLYAVSSPTLLVTPDDPLGAVVLSLIHHNDGVTATAAGTGVVGTDDTAAAFLDTWCEEIAIVRDHDQQRSGSSANRLRGD